MMGAPVTVLQANTKRDSGKKAQYGNIMAGKVRRGGDQRAEGASRRRSVAAAKFDRGPGGWRGAGKVWHSASHALRCVRRTVACMG